MNSILAVFVFCSLLVISLAICAPPAMAISIEMHHIHAIGIHSFLDSNYNWSGILNWLISLKQQYQQQTRSVPVPGTLLLFGAGLLGFAVWRGRIGK